MSAFDTPQKAIDWARSRIDEGTRAIKAYLQADPFTLVVEEDAESGDQVTILRLAKEPPPEVEGNFRNALVDLKHSFDQSLYAAAQTMGCVRFKKNFPWADSPVGTNAIISSWQRDRNTRLPQVLVDELLRQEPYATGPSHSGGNDLIREVAKMANDKHTIGFTAGAVIQSLQLRNVSFRGGSGALGGRWDPVKKQIEVSRRVSGEPASYDNPRIAGNVFFERAGPIGEIPVEVVTAAFADRAQVSLDGLKSVCTT